MTEQFLFDSIEGAEIREEDDEWILEEDDGWDCVSRARRW
jgi:hypothetical protein